MTQLSQNTPLVEVTAAPLSAQPERSVVGSRWSDVLELRLPLRPVASELSFETLQRAVGLRAEAYLAHAVLVDAIECFKKYAWAETKAQRKLHREARKWLAEDVVDANRLTCGFICDSLGIDRIALIEMLRDWHAAESARQVVRIARGSRSRRIVCLESPNIAA
jgi:hypothetical protein